MKRVIISIVFNLMVINSISSLTFSATLRTPSMQRKLSSASLIDAQINEEVKKVSVAKIREEIVDIHKNVKICLDEEFAKQPADILPFDEITRMCAGNNYSIIIRFYKDVNFQIKEIMKEKIKGELKNGFCDNILFQCVAFFKALEMFMEKDYDIMKAIDLNRTELEKQIDEDRLNYMVRLTGKEIGDYNAIRQDLIDERKFLTEYFTEQFNAYKEKYGSASYVRDDTLIAEENLSNPEEDTLLEYADDPNAST